MSFLTITETALTYHETASEAVLAAGVEQCWSALPTRAVSALAPGDELDLNDHASVVRLTGKNERFDYNAWCKRPS